MTKLYVRRTYQMAEIGGVLGRGEVLVTLANCSIRPEVVLFVRK